jgi:hypothetical protein
MNKPGQRIATLLMMPIIILMLMGCIFTAAPELATTPALDTPVPGMLESPNPAYINAQATLDFGQGQLLELSRRSTQISLERSQAENAAAQSTLDFYLRQQIDSDFQATQISLNIGQAAATQEFFAQQTRIILDATALVQSNAETATASANLAKNTQVAQDQAVVAAQATQSFQAAATQSSHHLTETVQVQLIQNVQSTQTAQSAAAAIAYPLTATPLAITQAALLMQQYDREKQSFENQVVAPLIPVFAIVILILSILGTIWIYRKFMPPQRSLIPRPASLRYNSRRLLPFSSGISEHNSWYQRIIPLKRSSGILHDLPGKKILEIEIVNAQELWIALWIVEAEDQLITEGKLLP